MGKRNAGSPITEIDVKRIKTEFGEDLEFITVNPESVQDAQPYFFKIEKPEDDWKGEENKGGFAKGELLEEPEQSGFYQITEFADGTDQALPVQTVNSQDWLDLSQFPQNVICQKLDDGRTVYIIPNSEDAAAASINFSTAEAENVDEVSADQPEQIVGQVVRKVKVTLKRIDIKIEISLLASMLEAQGVIPRGTYLRAIMLQGVQELDADKSLAEQCINADGFVDVPLEVELMSDGTATINILNVFMCDSAKLTKSHQPRVPKPKKQEPPQPRPKINFDDSMEFRNIMAQCGMPEDVTEWTTEHVRIWLEWAKQHYNIQDLNVEEVALTGADLMLHEVGSTMESLGVTDALFHTHITILITNNHITIPTLENSEVNGAAGLKVPSTRGNRTGNNGQIQLWQFLLELLLDKNYKAYISWEEGNARDGTFLMKEPQTVARLWGERKNKPRMNYESMSRAMRYYYENKLITKVQGKKFGYQFVCDLKQMIGYSAMEIQEMLEGEMTEETRSLLEQLTEMLRKPGGVKKIVQPSEQVYQPSEQVYYYQPTEQELAGLPTDAEYYVQMVE